MQGLITDIQRFSIHDGPGIRTTVFLKGCNLRCFWCHNPETLRGQPELQVDLSRCIGCGACFATCPQGAHKCADNTHIFVRSVCQACGRCAQECFAEGLQLVGRAMTADEVVAQVQQDAAFYVESGGGVTLSGGEPLQQHAFAAAILQGCRAAGIHTALETNLAWPWARLAAVLPHTDLVMCDLKSLDPVRHQQGTGVSNRQVLANLQRLAETGLPLIVRTPVIPGFNDEVAAIAAIAGYVAQLSGVVYYELLPYHPLGTAKYAQLGLPVPAALTPVVDVVIATLAEAAQAAGVPVRVAGRPFGRG